MCKITFGVEGLFITLFIFLLFRDKNEDIKVHRGVNLSKERRKTRNLLMIELFRDYAQNSNLHGLRYIAGRGLNINEKYFVFFIIVIGIKWVIAIDYEFTILIATLVLLSYRVWALLLRYIF